MSSVTVYLGVVYTGLAGVEVTARKLREQSLQRLSVLPWLAVLLCCGLILLLVPASSFTVDRDSALETFWHSILDQEFPYAVPTDQGSPISGLPFLMLVALPAVLVGETGLLQPLGVALFLGLVLTKLKAPYLLRTQLGLLVLTAPWFWWEVAARSELWTNMVLVVAVLLFLPDNDDGQKHSRLDYVSSLGGIALGLVMCTRVIALLPALVFASAFVSAGLRRFSLILGGVLFGFLLPFIPLVAWDLEAFRADNPLLVQSSYLPPPVVLGLAVAALIAGHSSSTIHGRLHVAGILLFMSVLLGWLTHSITRGEGNFDISYFQLAAPFFLAAMAARKGVTSAPGGGLPPTQQIPVT